MDLFVAWKLNTHYVHLYILGYEHFGCVEDECTYYLRLYIVGHEHFCCVEVECTLLTFIYLRL